jgi:hypothetical protein
MTQQIAGTRAAAPAKPFTSQRITDSEPTNPRLETCATRPTCSATDRDQKKR